MDPNQPLGAPAPVAPVVPQPAAPVGDPSQPVPFELGTPGEHQPAPAPVAQPEAMPAWAEQFTNSMNEKVTSLEAALATNNQPAPAPAAPTSTESELAALNPQSWDQVDKYVAEKIQTGVQNGIEQFTTSLQQQNAQAQQAKDAVDAELDAAVATLERSNIIPPITNPNDRNDPGRMARRELYGLAAKLGTTDLNAVATTTMATLHAQGKMYDPITDSIIDGAPAVPGASAPIGSSTGTTGMNQTGPTYADIHGARSMDELRARAGL